MTYYRKCRFCGNAWIPGGGCSVTDVAVAPKTARSLQAGVVFAHRIPFGEESDRGVDRTCPDCGAGRGEYHHPGCDVEDCPFCEEQLISCGHLHGYVGAIERSESVESESVESIGGADGTSESETEPDDTELRGLPTEPVG